MKLCIAGSRGLHPTPAQIDSVIIRPDKVSAVVSGTAAGADRAGEHWAKLKRIPVIQMPADWQTHGRRAGYLRNQQMVAEADCFLIFWDGTSPGTKHMIELVKSSGKPIALITMEPTP